MSSTPRARSRLSDDARRLQDRAVARVARADAFERSDERMRTMRTNAPKPPRVAPSSPRRSPSSVRRRSVYRFPRAPKRD